MKTAFKSFIFGLVVGGLAAYAMGYNHGRGAPLLSNPFAARDLPQEVKEKVKEKTGEAIEKARETIHEATKPVQKEIEKQMNK